VVIRFTNLERGTPLVRQGGIWNFVASNRLFTINDYKGTSNYLPVNESNAGIIMGNSKFRRNWSTGINIFK
jgi:hypothetical protein